MSDQRDRNPLAIVIAVVSLVVQGGAWFWWGGRVETRVEAGEKRMEAIEQREAAAALTNGAQDVSIAVITTQLSTIQSTVDRIDKRLEQRR